MFRIHAVNKRISLATLDLNLLVVFDAILADHSITAAAQRVGLSQPAMSSALARLRKAFNDPLFVRTARGMQPTPYAQVLAAPIQQACTIIANSLELGATFDPLTARRTFTFYMTDIGEGIFLPKLLRALEQRAPHANVRVQQIPARGEQDAMASGEVDIALGLFPDLKGGFFQQRLYRDQFVCLLRSDHPQAKGSITARQLAEMRNVLITSAGTGHQIALSRAFAHQHHRRRIALTIPHFMAVPVIVSQTDYIVMVPRRLALAFAGFAGIRIVESPVRIPSIEIKQHWHERYHQDPANRWIRSLVAELFLE